MQAGKTDVAGAPASHHRSSGIGLTQANETNQNVRTVPATYVIGPHGEIKLAFFDADYRPRASIRQVVLAR